MLTLEQAKTERRCRLCEEPITIPFGPVDWPDRFGGIEYPVRVRLEFGKEFAHVACLEKGTECRPEN